MSIKELLAIWSDQLAISVLIWMLFIIVLLYLARSPAHKAIHSGTMVLRNAMRLAASALQRMENKLLQRNREVLLASGQDATEKLIEREFHRVNATVQRDLSGYPNLQRRLNEQISKIDEDYQQATDVPPPPPAWVKAVEAVAKLRTEDSSMVGRILEDIHTTVSRAQRNALEEYRDSNAKRHSLLKGMMPYWRNLSQNLEHVNKTIGGLEERSRIIDHQMEQYEQIRRGVPRAERTLHSSSMTQFFIAGLVLFIAMIGGVINFYLISLPMSEMVGGSSMLGPFKTSSVAALVIIMIEIAMGLFLMESLRITHMFPVIGSMNDQTRRRMLWITFSILLILACVESSLAFMRDLLAADREALRQTLSGIQATNPEFRWIPSIGQMVMGFVLPFALTFVAIPLESFVYASRTVFGSFLAGALHGMKLLLRLFGSVFYQSGNLLISIYDLVIFIPLRIEDAYHNRAAGKAPPRTTTEQKAITNYADTIHGGPGL